ncbi:histidinol-phosphate transaminase [Gloeocapsa sp. PCC 73106]|uniref:histidinol-phosphate transaminase n=1 Tax=Gloeocapsa sp. PCC 73106 TaxID=102232 RepID=UPI0002AC9B3E|nr:histidinol-phosphate transaminase [Gloeocapsa sp. PCC 73106]ELR99386.1 histidinol-phosphate aminotransferase [Gloeocapsa sp. PCC 73106]
MVGFIRADLAALASYTPHTGGTSTEGVDRLDTNESPYDLPLELQAKLSSLYQHQLENNRYPDGSHQELKQAIATYVGQKITPDQISLGNGSDELIRSVLIATCVGGAGSVLVADPTFSMYEIIAKTLAIPVIKIPRRLEDFSVDLDAAAAVIANQQLPPLRVIFLVHPNSPTGNLLNSTELNWLYGLPSDILVVIDEAYFEYSQNSLVTAIAERPNWVILRTFSKAFRLAAHRLGYAIASPEFTTALEKVRLPYNLPSFSQTAALIALNHRQELLACIPEILAERQRLTQSLAQYPHFRLWSSSANFIYLCPQNPSLDLAQFTQNLKTRGTLIRHTAGGLRVTVGTPAENTRTLEHFEALINQNPY